VDCHRQGRSKNLKDDESYKETSMYRRRACCPSDGRDAMTPRKGVIKTQGFHKRKKKTRDKSFNSGGEGHVV